MFNRINIDQIVHSGALRRSHAAHLDMGVAFEPGSNRRSQFPCRLFHGQLSAIAYLALVLIR
jgi:hypothetical protein